MNAKSSLTRVPKNISSGQRARFVAPFERSGRTPRLDSTSSSQRRTDHRERSLHTKGIYRVDRGTYIDSALREIYGAYKVARSASSNRDRGLADHVLKDTAIRKRQPDLATRMVLEQDSLVSSGNYKQPTILRLPLDFVDHAVESITACVSVRERSVHSEDNQTLSLRKVDPIADDGVWAIIDDGCNCCCLDEVWRQNADAKMKFGCTGRRLLSTAQERAQQTESRKFPRALF